MPNLIHEVLFEKLKKNSDWHTFAAAFRTITGSEVLLLEKTPSQVDGSLGEKVDVSGVSVAWLTVFPTDTTETQATAWRCLLRMAAENFSATLALSHIHDHEPMPPAIRKAIDWIREQAPVGETRLSEAARACGISASHLSRRFHHSTGMTFREYATRVRLERAIELLENSDTPVTSIAFECGFQSVSQFHRAFKATFGKRPLSCRKFESGGPSARKKGRKIPALSESKLSSGQNDLRSSP